MEPNSKRIWILLGLVAIIVIITIVAATSRQTQNIAPESPAMESGQEEGQVDEAEEANLGLVESAQESNPALKDARQDVPNSINLITKEGQVVNLQGVAVKTDLPMTSPEAPQQTGPVNKEDLAASVIQLEMNLEKGITPAEFTVNRGEAVSISVSSTDQWTHIFKFEDPALRAVAIGVSSGETRGMSFNAPSQPGEYRFFCDLPGHANRGEVGKMIVK